MKSIWIINHYADPPGPGKFTRHFNFAKKLQERGYQVKIFTASTIHTTDVNFITNTERYKEMTIDGVDFVFVRASDYHGNSGKRIKNMLDYFLRVPMVTRNFESPDIVYTSAPHSLTWLAAYRIAKKAKAKFIVETRDLWPETFIQMGTMKKNSIPAKILYKIEEFIYKKADALIFTFPGGQEYLDSIGLDKKAHYVNNGIDLKQFEKLIQEEFVDKDLNDLEKFNVCFTGALGFANGLDRVLYSFKELEERGYSNIQLLLFGSGGEEEKLRQIVEENNIKNVIFKGRVDKAQVPSIIKKADLLLLSHIHSPGLYRFGISPNKLSEYFASGKPVISNVECGYDHMEKYNSGLTVKGDSVEALTEGILYFYNLDKEEYNKYCENSKNAAKEFDFDKLTNTLVEVFEEGD